MYRVQLFPIFVNWQNPVSPKRSKDHALSKFVYEIWGKQQGAFFLSSRYMLKSWTKIGIPHSFVWRWSGALILGQQGRYACKKNIKWYEEKKFYSFGALWGYRVLSIYEIGTFIIFFTKKPVIDDPIYHKQTQKRHEEEFFKNLTLLGNRK